MSVAGGACENLKRLIEEGDVRGVDSDEVRREEAGGKAIELFPVFEGRADAHKQLGSDLQTTRRCQRLWKEGKRRKRHIRVS